MDHERYPYYFGENQAGLRAVHFEHARDAMLALGNGFKAVLRGIGSLVQRQPRPGTR
jgi:hypothetical protein